MRSNPFLVVFVAAAALGLLFAGVSTWDFAQYLDRQVHGVHCSFVPGIAPADLSGESGCLVTMMSPYSSLFRKAFWGGLPVALPGMAVFAFLLFKVLEALLLGKLGDRTATRVLLAATGVPVLTSVVMGVIALVQLGAFCKLCVGIYAASALALVGAVGLWRRAGADAAEHSDPPPAATRAWVVAVLQGVLFVAIPVTAWAALVPDHEPFVGTCGRLEHAEDPHGVMIALDGHAGGVPSIELLDPLCPACSGFEDRLQTSGLADRLDRKVLLFPLDATCNWMVSSTLHPGACAVSEAVLCAGPDATQVIAWALDNQADIRAATAADPEAAARMVTARFPAVEGCLGKPAVRARLNHALRWTVKNAVPVLTPQLYVDGVRLCDEDTDLGMDFALDRMLAMHAEGRLDGGAR